MNRLLFSECEAIIRLMVAISFLVTDRLRYVMIVSIPDNINHQELERKLFLKKTYSEVLNPKLKRLFARERVPYFNEKGELVGYDMAYAYDLARSLNVRLQLIPFDWNTLISDLENNRLDILMSALYIIEERLKRVMVSQSYFQSPAALIVPSRRADQFLSASGIQTMDHLTLTALNAQVARSFVQQTFPNAKVIVLNSYDEVPRHPEIDAGLWTLVQGAVWSQSHPGYTAVVPRNFGSVMLFGYLMPPGAEALARFVNYWLDLRKADGFEKKQYNYWIQGEPRKDSEHRWCIIRNVLHWVD